FQILCIDLASYRKLIEGGSKVAGRFFWSTVAKGTARFYEMHLARVRAAIVNSPRLANAAYVVLQIVPRVSDNPDGVTDYALNLARNLLAQYQLTTVFAAAEPSQISEKEGLKIASMAGGSVLGERPAHVILHYVNYGYQRRGLPFSSLPVWHAFRE